MARSLIVDVGNSKVAVALCDGGEDLRFLARMATPGEVDGDSGIAALAAQLTDIGRSEGAGRLVLASVVPRLDAALCAPWSDALRIDSTCRLPFVVKVNEPETVGADRFCNLAAAVDAGMADALVVDAGTATTIDLLLDGVFVGGLIAPGMAFAAECLAQRAACLRPVDFAPMPLEVGADTDAAMAGGAWHVGRNGVLATVEQLLQRYGDRPVILTGGLAPFLQQTNWVLDSKWTLRGAAVIGRI